MFIIYEYAACVLVAWIGTTMLFAACVMFLAFEEACTIGARKLQMLKNGEIPLIGRRTEVKPRE